MVVYLYLWPGLGMAFQELVAPLLRLISLTTKDEVLVTQKFHRNAKHFVLGAHLHTRYPQIIPKNSVLINFEQLYFGKPWFWGHYISLLLIYEVWDYSLANCRFLKKLSSTPERISHFQLGFCPEWLPSTSPREKDIDVLFYGGLNGRRQSIIDRLRDHDVKVMVRCNDLWGEEKSDLIRRSRVVLNIHYYRACLLEMPRIFQALHFRAFVISEECSDWQDYSFLEGGLVISSFQEIIDTVLQYLRTEEERERIAQRGYEIISNLKITT